MRNPNVFPFQRFIETEKAGYLIRQYLLHNLYDRIGYCLAILFSLWDILLIYSSLLAQHTAFLDWNWEEMDSFPAPACISAGPLVWYLPRWHQVWECACHLLCVDISHRLCLLQANTHTWSTNNTFSVLVFEQFCFPYLVYLRSSSSSSNIFISCCSSVSSSYYPISLYIGRSIGLHVFLWYGRTGHMLSSAREVLCIKWQEHPQRRPHSCYGHILVGVPFKRFQF